MATVIVGMKERVVPLSKIMAGEWFLMDECLCRRFVGSDKYGHPKIEVVLDTHSWIKYPEQDPQVLPVDVVISWSLKPDPEIDGSLMQQSGESCGTPINTSGS